MALKKKKKVISNVQRGRDQMRRRVVRLIGQMTSTLHQWDYENTKGARRMLEELRRQVDELRGGG